MPVCELHSSDEARHHFLPAVEMQVVVIRTRAFLVVNPQWWYSLPQNDYLAPSVVAFGHQDKTEPFRLAFNILRDF